MTQFFPFQLDVTIYDAGNAKVLAVDGVFLRFLCTRTRETAGKRFVVVSTGPLWRDYDDVKRYEDAAVAGTKL